MNHTIKIVKYFLAYLFIGLAVGSYFPILSSYLKNDLQFSGSEVGTITAVTTLISIITLPLWGYLTDLIKSPKKTLLMSLVFSSIMMVVVSNVSTYGGFLVIISLFMIFRAPVFGLYDEILIDVCKRNRINYGSMRIGGSVGFAISLFVGSFFTRLFGNHIQFMLSALFFFIVATLILISEDVDYRNKENIDIKVDVPILLRNRAFVFVILIQAIAFGVMDSNMTYMSTYLTEFSQSDRFVSLAVFLSAIIEFPVLYSTRFIYKKFTLKQLFIFVNAINIMKYTLLFLRPSTELVLILAPIHGITFGLSYPIVVQFIKENVKDKVMATAYAVYNALLSLATAVVNYAIGFSLDLFESNIENIFIIYIVIYGVNMLLIMTLLRKVHYKAVTI